MKQYTLLILLILLPTTIPAQSNGNNPDLSIDDNVDNHPNTPKIKVKREVIDTVQAKIMYQRIKPSLMINYDVALQKKNRCDELYASSIEKVKTKEDWTLLNDAYNHAFNLAYQKQKDYYSLNEFYTLYYDKAVKKGKLTNAVRNALAVYSKT